jgi:hypothetical protein
MKSLFSLQEAKGEDPADEKPKDDHQNSAGDPDGIPVGSQKLAEQRGRRSEDGEENAEPQDEKQRMNENNPVQLSVRVFMGKLFEGKTRDESHVGRDQRQDAGGKEGNHPGGKSKIKGEVLGAAHREVPPS